MPRRQSSHLTDGEMRIMRVLWEREDATVGDIAARIEGQPRPAYNTVLTMLRILERKGYVTHRKNGRAFSFRPLIDRGAARKSALSQLLARFFDGSPELLVLDLLGQERVSGEERRRVRELIEGSALGERRRERGKP